LLSLLTGFCFYQNINQQAVSQIIPEPCWQDSGALLAGGREEGFGKVISEMCDVQRAASNLRLVYSFQTHSESLKGHIKPEISGMTKREKE